ncbi:siphovirus ReqiPepy6 Gp37-like family protein [Psychrobacillus sp. BM2]|uniref:siphovirus ReqiPepy6 Gp37-like family protein n=1 Tax=Psychrobacillus sp. BM2 TaxID=3400421 RepID=UPI003B01A13C
MNINVLNHDLDRLGLVDAYKSLSFIRNYNDVGSFQIVIDVTSKHSKLLQMDNIVMINADETKVGIIDSIGFGLDNEGNEVKTVKGKTLGVILDDRMIIPHENESQDKVQLNIESILHHYVNNHCINPNDILRKYPFLSATKDKKRGRSIRWTSRYGRLLDEIKTISGLYAIGWRFVLDLDLSRWLFDVYEGRDLTVNQDVHTPVIFSPKFENIYDMELIETNTNERNFAYVGAEGEGASRKIYNVGTAEGLARKEIFFEINPNEDGMYIDPPEQASRQLDEYYYIINLTAGIRDCDMFKFERDYDLGDMVTIHKPEWDYMNDLRIISIEEVFDDNGKQIFATFGEHIPSIIDRTKQELKIFEPYIKK